MKRYLIQAAGGDGFLDFTDGCGDLDLSWAGERAVEDRMAAVHPKLVIEDS